jgi:hypothetical protein
MGLAMKYSTWSFPVVSILLAVSPLLSPASLEAHDTDSAGLILAQAPSSKQHRINVCRARYRDCLSRKEIPSFECKAVYQDCTRSVI